MENEKQRERLVELLNEATFGVNTQTLADHLKKETIERVADYLLANNVVVLPEGTLPEITSQIYYEDLEELWVRQKYYCVWETERKILKAKENDK